MSWVRMTNEEKRRARQIVWIASSGQEYEEWQKYLPKALDTIENLEAEVEFLRNELKKKIKEISNLLPEVRGEYE